MSNSCVGFGSIQTLTNYLIRSKISDIHTALVLSGTDGRCCICKYLTLCVHSQK